MSVSHRSILAEVGVECKGELVEHFGPFGDGGSGSFLLTIMPQSNIIISVRKCKKSIRGGIQNEKSIF